MQKGILSSLALGKARGLRNSLLGGVCLLLAACAKQSSPAKSYTQDLRFGHELIDQGRYEDAINYFRGILENYRGQNLESYSGEEVHQGIATAYAGLVGIRDFRFIDSFQWDEVEKSLVAQKLNIGEKPSGKDKSLTDETSDFKKISKVIGVVEPILKSIPDVSLAAQPAKRLTEAIAWLDVAQTPASKRIQAALELVRARLRLKELTPLVAKASTVCQWYQIGEGTLAGLTDLVSARTNMAFAGIGTVSQTPTEKLNSSELSKTNLAIEQVVGASAEKSVQSCQH